MPSRKKRKLNQTSVMVVQNPILKREKHHLTSTKKNYQHATILSKFKCLYPDLIDLVILKDGRIVLFRDL